ncbi:OmpA family protein [Runella sp.]|uniref:OmpA family protein n=1 Tax=Runella sp. TaxID=1960881 RepID=UPI003D0E144E
MFTSLLSWLFCIYGYFPFQSAPAQVANAIRINGSCRDNTSKDYLKQSVVYAVFQSSRKLVGKSDETGNFDFQIPDSTKYLSFEVEKYHTATIPVNFIGKIAGSSKFPVFVEMSLKDSLPLQVRNQFIACLIVSDSMDIDHKMENTAMLSFGMLSFRKRYNNGKHWPFFHSEGFKQGKYLYTASSPEGRLYLKKEMTLVPGFNFTDVRINKPEELQKTIPQPQMLEEVVAKSLKKKFLYFDQSSYELRDETKASLDSVSRFLIREQEMAAHVTGYTDNVGERGKNLTLSEFRAKMVMNYLTRKGVRAEQIIIQWKGSDTSTPTDDSEESKTKKRRVEIQFLPK